MIDYYFKTAPKEEVSLDILDSSGKVVRHISSKEKKEGGKEERAHLHGLGRDTRTGKIDARQSGAPNRLRASSSAAEGIQWRKHSVAH